MTTTDAPEDRPGAAATRLRPEARPASYERLDADQRRGFDRLVDLLSAAVAEIDRLPRSAESRRETSRPTGPMLEHARSSRTVLISGGRGTGKSTLMLSLISAVREPPPAHDTGVSPAPPRTMLQALNRRVVWLETLDLEPLPEGTSLLGAILARIEAAAGEYLRPRLGDAESTVASPPLLMSRDSTEHVAMRELIRLQTAVATSVDGNLRARAGSLDPDSFAVEARKAERGRLGLNRSFADCLALLAEAVTRTTGGLDGVPLFVLPIDDLDLNPSACVTLLELLRAVHSPHLLVLMAADEALLDTVLRLKYKREFRAAGGQADLDEDEKTQALDLAAHAKRKHIPQTQHIRLLSLGGREALGFVPLGGSREQALKTLLADVRLVDDEVWMSPSSSRVQLRGLSLATAAEVELAGESPVFSWPSLLQAPLRDILDLYEQASTEEAPQSWFTDWISQRSALHGVVSGLETEDVSVSVSPIPLGEDMVTAGTFTIETQRLIGWEVNWNHSRLGPSDSTLVAGAFDLLGSGSVLPSLRLDLPVTLRVTLTATTNQRFPWPMPQHSTGWGYEWVDALLRAADRRWQGYDVADPLFGAWVEVMTAVVARAVSPAEPEPGPIEPGGPESGQDAWALLKSRLQRLGTIHPLAKEWTEQALALCTPEMGLVASSSPIWPDEPEPQLRERVQRLRNPRIDGLPASGQETVRAWRLVPGRRRVTRKATPEPRTGRSTDRADE